MDAAAKKKRGRKTAGDGRASQPVVAEYRVMDGGAEAVVEEDDVNRHVILRIKEPSEEDTRGADVAPSVTDAGADFAVAALEPSSACFWCCHRLHGPPVGIPTKQLPNGRFGVAGTFCSHECAAAFIFNSRELHLNPWASYNLLNVMARHAGARVPVKEAPSRFCLRMFGGWMDIDEFRSGNSSFSPMPANMVAISQVMEDSCCGGSGISKDGSAAFIPLDHDRVMKAKQNLMKQSASTKNSIHNKMNLLVR